MRINSKNFFLLFNLLFFLYNSWNFYSSTYEYYDTSAQNKYNPIGLILSKNREHLIIEENSDEKQTKLGEKILFKKQF